MKLCRYWRKPNGSFFFPFFLSLDTLKRSIESNEICVGLPGKTLFEITSGTTLFLNPRGPYGKEFLPSEIDALLGSDAGRECSTVS